MVFFVNAALSCAVPAICCLLRPGGLYQTCWWSLISKRSVKESAHRIKGNSFSFSRDCIRTKQPCSAWWWATTSAHNCHARTHSIWSMEYNQGITWWTHHSYHQEEESKLCYHQVIWNFVRGGIRLLPILQTEKDFITCSHLASTARYSKCTWKVCMILLPVTEQAV